MWRKVIDAYPDFEIFVLRGTEEIGELTNPQISYLRANGTEVDFIGRQKTFERDITTVLEVRYQLVGPDPCVQHHE